MEETFGGTKKSENNLEKEKIEKIEDALEDLSTSKEYKFLRSWVKSSVDIFDGTSDQDGVVWNNINLQGGEIYIKTREGEMKIIKDSQGEDPREMHSLFWRKGDKFSYATKKSKPMKHNQWNESPFPFDGKYPSVPGGSPIEEENFD